jgi:proteasome lid subunit RPN8/RPN11
LSTDDIVFDEVTYREPRRVRRPDRDRRWACLAYELPRGADLPIFLDRKPADTIERHALRDTSVELGGILLGQECVDDVSGEPFVWITEALEAKHYENTQASFTYTHDSWEEITRERDRLHPDLDIVGWYHTHPDFGVFLSGHDLFIHHNFFAQPLQVAYVVDPVRQTRGFFQWRDGAMDQVGGFYLAAERGDRVALARLANELENFSNTEGAAGSGLSPRLEAELINMLTRPQHYQSVPATAPQSAAVFTLLGVALGALAVIGALWLQSLTQGLQEQTAEIKNLKDNVARAAKDYTAAVDATRVRVKTEDLDRLLGEVKAGARPGRFTEIYNEAVADRDEARHELEKLTIEKNILTEGAAALTKEKSKLTKSLEESRKKLEDTEKELKQREDKYEALFESNQKLEDSFADSRAGELIRKYNITWWVAVGGAGTSIALLLALVTLWARFLPEPPTAEAPTHEIT